MKFIYHIQVMNQQIEGIWSGYDLAPDLWKAMVWLITS